MTASPHFASRERTAAAAEDPSAPAANAGPFVLNLCSSSTPMALAQTDLPELKRFTFFVSRRFEEGRERFRLHMGYFATLAEAEEWLGLVREIYPGAWAGETPGRKLRERAAAAVAEQAQQAAGPQSHLAPAPRAPAPVVAAAPRPARPDPVHVPVLQPPLSPPVLSPPVVNPPATRRATQPAPSAPRPQSPAPRRTAAAAAPAHLKAAPAPAARRPAAPVARGAPARAAAPSARSAPKKPVFEDSNVREVLKALADTAGTGETRVMHAPSPPRAVPAADPSLSDSQVLKLLESRQREQSDRQIDVRHDGIVLLKPDDTGTRQALRDALANNAPVSFAVQLQWSVQPVELDKVPPLAIFSAYTLYTVEGSREGRKWYGLRLGFFSDAISAKQVAYYVRSEFASVAVVPVSPQERGRASDDNRKAATIDSPISARVDYSDEFKLIDDTGSKRPPAVPVRAAQPAPKPEPKLLTPVPVPRARTAGKVGARERRGAHTFEETLEILGAGELSIDNGRGEVINASGLRNVRAQAQQRNSPFAKLLVRLSERMKKP